MLIGTDVSRDQSMNYAVVVVFFWQNIESFMSHLWVFSDKTLLVM